MALWAMCCGLAPVAGQTLQTLPVDSAVRIGRLDNGLTYYIRHNALPAQRAEFYIAQKVGSILEEPQQRGLAHFLEHMAFNGTRSFPDRGEHPGVVSWCESKGIRFGTNLNAYTSVDQTVYNISNVPTDNPSVVDSCLLILHDWSGFINLDGEEIDKERGVIREEWRSTDNGMQRILRRALPVIYAGSKYADCLPIGDIDVINTFPHTDLKAYYAKWYRPDLQGIMVVGDVDVDSIENKIRQLFADIQAPARPAERVRYPVPDNDEPLIFIGTDREVKSPSFNIFFKSDAFPAVMKNTAAYYATRYMASMVTGMLNVRLRELLQQPDPPFTGASASYGSYYLAKTKDAFMLSAGCQTGGIRRAMQTVLQEVERARRFGFTDSEYRRTRANYLQAMESAYNERDKRKNGTLVAEYVAHFLDGEPIPGLELEYSLVQQLAAQIPLLAINQMVTQLVTDRNQVVLLGGPEQPEAGYPTQQEVASWLRGMKELHVTPYEDHTSDEPLLSEEPQGGHIVSEEAGHIYGTTRLLLSNGVEVYIKPTDFKADQILMQGISFGGTSLFPDSEVLNSSQINGVATVGGLGNFSQMALSKALAGRRVSVGASVGPLTEGISGNCSVRDFETMLQLTYLYFTSPRQDEEAFRSYQARLKASLHNRDANPMTAFQDTVSHTLYGPHPRLLSLTEAMVDSIDYHRVMQLYTDRFQDASDFRFYLVGSIDIEQMKPLIARYLGGLPAAGRRESFADRRMRIRKGEITNEFARQQQTPMATVMFLYHGKCRYDLHNLMAASFVQQALNLVYTEEIREKEGGSYGVSCQAALNRYPRQELTLQIQFQTDPEPSKRERLEGIVRQQLRRMAEEGPSAAHMQKIKEYLHKSYRDAQRENGYWLSQLHAYFYTGIDATAGYEALIDAMTARDIQQFLRRLLRQRNCIRVVMTVPQADSTQP